MEKTEQQLWADVVKTTNRTTTKLEWLWDSALYILDGGESKFIPRHVAMAGINSHPMSIDQMTGLTSDSLIGIDEPNSKYPVTALDVDVKEIAEMPKSEDSSTIIGGKIVKKKVINLDAHKENFQANNV